MVKAVPDILARILEQKKMELRTREPGLETRAEASLSSRRDFRAALTSRSLAVIAEIKKASPSKGLIAPNFNPAVTAEAYSRGGAAALSVLTDANYFQGSLDHLQEARSAVELPVLRKDFTIDEYQVVEAAAYGADAILLIVAALGMRQLRSLREVAKQYRMDALVEVHDEEELGRAIDSGAEMIGVNNRDLRTFEVSLDVCLRLAARIPSSTVKIAESGIHSAGDLRTLHDAGYSGFLVGEHLMRSGDPERALRVLLQ